ncbi:MAG TPA: arsenic transporter [Gemmatimonadales bacterium]|jgi:arsenical pump membrane protein
MPPPAATLAIWAIAAATTTLILVRPFRLHESVWAVAAATLLAITGLLPLPALWNAVLRGQDVYLFLLGMMLLSEVARREGLFDWVAAVAVHAARGSGRRLFLLIYIIGVAVTTVLSNDATAVVLTPAVIAVTRRARVDALPFLLICAFTANAASFVLPISNPANLVLFDGRMPPLLNWLHFFLLPAVVAIVATFIALRWLMRRRIPLQFDAGMPAPALGRSGLFALACIATTAVALLAASARGLPLGPPTLIVAAVSVAVLLAATRKSPAPVLRGVSWSILPLVAGLFVVVEAVTRTGVVANLARLLQHATITSPAHAAMVASGSVALASNLINNLPAGLIASSTLMQAHAPPLVTSAAMIGVDLGTNLSITGSLATILWLTALRREGEDLTFGTFLRIGLIVMPPALILAVAARLLIG